MTIANKERVLVSLAREIAEEMGLDFHSFSQGWILRLGRGEAARHIFGYNFELNSATAQQISSDKSATADLLAHQGVPHVPHRLFLHPDLAGYVSSAGNWPQMEAYVEQHGFPIVVKANEGTGGEEVHKVDSPLELEQVVAELFKKERAICFSPFLEIEQEYRAIVLDGECVLLYAKRRPQIVGDGQSSVLNLIEQLALDPSLPKGLAAQAMDHYYGDLSKVPDKGQEIVISWKHNLVAGAQPMLVDEGELHDQICALAEQARAAVNIRFASIDIVAVGGELSVLEVNSGVMMEYFSRKFEGGRARARAIYQAAIEKMMAG